MGVHRSWVSATALVLLAAGISAALPPTVAVGAVVPVVVQADAGTVVHQSAGCDGMPFTQAGPLGVSIHRGTGDDASQPVDLGLSYSGSLVAGTDYQPLPSHLVIPAGVSTSRVTAARITTSPGTLTVTASGPAAPSGSSTADTAAITVPACQILPTATLQLLLDRQFSVRLVDLFPSFDTSLARGDYEYQSGALPQGSALASVYLSGLPTSLGSYHGVFDACVAYQVCVQRLTFDIQVVSNITPPPSSAGPGATTQPAATTGTDGTAAAATPVVATATFTG